MLTPPYLSLIGVYPKGRVESQCRKSVVATFGADPDDTPFLAIYSFEERPFYSPLHHPGKTLPCS